MNSLSFIRKKNIVFFKKKWRTPLVNLKINLIISYFLPTNKALLRALRDVIFDFLLAYVQSVCTQYEIDIPHMNASYKKTTSYLCQ
jgi:hypothetical protein